MNTNVLDMKISEIEKRFPKVSSLVKKTDCEAKLKDTEGKHFITADYNKFATDMLEVKIKQN